jgi:cell wall-associated NlpC family hydrolase
MRRLPRISVRVSAAVVGVALCVAVAVLAATGTFSGSTKHARLTVEQRRLHIAQRNAQRALHVAEQRAAQADCPRVKGRVGHLPRERYSGTVEIAERYLGVPYVWGGASPKGFDSSGLVMYVYAQLGVSLPHYSFSQYCYPSAVHPSRSELQPGDLVFFDGRGNVGIYIGNNEFIHAPHTGAVVRIESLTGWNSREYYGATRIRGKPSGHYA